MLLSAADKAHVAKIQSGLRGLRDSTDMTKEQKALVSERLYAIHSRMQKGIRREAQRARQSNADIGVEIDAAINDLDGDKIQIEETE